MFSLTLECSAEEKDLVSAELWSRGAAGITETDLPENRTRLQAFFEESACDPAALAEEFATYHPQPRQEPDTDWVRVSREAWQPIEVGERFFLVPDWRGDPTPPGRLRLETHPGRACGTGAHPATQLSLEAMERHVRPGDAVLDVGTGSGILSVAAKLLGAGLVVACDIDPDAVEVADANIHRDDIEVGLFVGSIRSVRSGSIDVIVANINAASIVGLAQEFARTGRTTIVTGFTEGEQAGVARALGLKPVESFSKQEWACLVFRL
ncbi:MAG: 50S ribosomal protein L11 methyltransferase [Bryobacteraceae bacterium]